MREVGLRSELLRLPDGSVRRLQNERGASKLAIAHLLVADLLAASQELTAAQLQAEQESAAMDNLHQIQLQALEDMARELVAADLIQEVLTTAETATAQLLAEQESAAAAELAAAQATTADTLLAFENKMSTLTDAPRLRSLASQELSGTLDAAALDVANARHQANDLIVEAARLAASNLLAAAMAARQRMSKESAAAGTTAAAQLAAQASAAAAQLLKTHVEAAQALAAQASAAAAQLVKTQVEAARELADLGEQFQLFMDISGIAAATVTRQGTFLVANPAMFTLMGRSKDSLLGSNWTDLIHPDDIEVFLAMVEDLETVHQSSQRTLVRYLDADGGVFWGDTSISAVVSPVGALPFRIFQIVGGSHLKDLQSELLTRATNDFLTGLANRATALVEIELAIQSGLDNGTMTAVLQLGLDGLAKINHQRGREAGDEVLQAAGGRIASAIREGDLVARVEGDTFAIIMRDLSNASEVDKRAALVIEAFHSPFLTHGLEAYVTASIGIAIAGPTLPIDAGDLLHQASEAMRQAKAQRGGRAVWFDVDLETASSEREQIEFGLRHALDRRELEVWYQPEIQLATGTVSAVEALVRWRHPDGSVWTAQRFIGVAEDSGLILDIGTWVLHQACKQGATWAAARPDRPITVRVNASALQLADEGLLKVIDDALAASDFNPTLLCIEITETALLHGTDQVSANIAGIHDRGITLAIDDFGTGYASLTYLHEYPIDLLKIDRSFVTNMNTEDKDRKIIAATIALAAVLEMAVTAEGVETSEQAELLDTMGCKSVQGWLYSKALPHDDITPLLDHSYSTPDGAAIG